MGGAAIGGRGEITDRFELNCERTRNRRASLPLAPLTAAEASADVQPCSGAPLTMVDDAEAQIIQKRGWTSDPHWKRISSTRRSCAVPRERETACVPYVETQPVTGRIAVCEREVCGAGRRGAVQVCVRGGGCVGAVGVLLPPPNPPPKAYGSRPDRVTR